jgi:hypothetical protein
VNYAKLLELNSFLTLHSFLEVGKTQDFPRKFWQTLGDALTSLCYSLSILTRRQTFLLGYVIWFSMTMGSLTQGHTLAGSRQPLHVGMDTDVWKSNYPYSISAKNANMDIRIRIRF